LERGFDITGIDTSLDMMDRCKEICNKKGLKPVLFKKSMLDFDLSRKFGLAILGSGGLGLFVHDKDIYSLFKQVMIHLKPGGLFVYEIESVPIDDNQRQNDKKWVGDWVNGPKEIILAWRNRYKYNATTHIWDGLFIIEKYKKGQLIETEANERVGRYFRVDEAIQYATSAGFESIKATNWLTDDLPNNDSKVITVQCRKPK
jgi:SAM-dependent methyltransferase